VYLVNDTQSPAGSWWGTFTDIAIGSTDGSVRPIYNRQKSVALTISCEPGVSSCNGVVGHPAGVGWAYFTTTVYYHGDHLGSSRFMSSYDGTPIGEATFRPFGEEHNPQIGVNHYKFTGLERDAESALDHTWFRKYAPASARWLSPDPVLRFGNPQRLNMYSYVLNNPLNMVDPLGADPDSLDPFIPYEHDSSPNVFGQGGCVSCQFSLEMLLGHALIMKLWGLGVPYGAAEQLAIGWLGCYFGGGPGKGSCGMTVTGPAREAFASLLPREFAPGHVIDGARPLRNPLLRLILLDFGKHHYIGIPNEANNGWKYCEVLGGSGGQQVTCNARDHVRLIPATPQQIARLDKTMVRFTTGGESCPSCGPRYQLIFNNSNSWVRNTLSCVGITPPSAPFFSPGYGPRPGGTIGWC
jgi:RHS repeat-associated protein